MLLVLSLTHISSVVDMLCILMLLALFFATKQYVVDWLCKIFCQPFSVLIIGCWEATMSAIYYALLTKCHTIPWTAIYHLMLEVYQTIYYWHSTLLFIMHCWQHAIPYREVSFIISCWTVLEVTKTICYWHSTLPLSMLFNTLHHSMNCQLSCQVGTLPSYLLLAFHSAIYYALLTTCFSIPWTASYHVKLEVYQAICCWHFTLPCILCMIDNMLSHIYHELQVIMSIWKSTKLYAVGI